MKIYKVKLWYSTHVTREIEAQSEEDAVERSVMMGLNTAQEKEALANIEAMEFNNEVTLADSQYTDLEEQQDREKDL